MEILDIESYLALSNHCLYNDFLALGSASKGNKMIYDKIRSLKDYYTNQLRLEGFKYGLNEPNTDYKKIFLYYNKHKSFHPNGILFALENDDPTILEFMHDNDINVFAFDEETENDVETMIRNHNKEADQPLGPQDIGWLVYQFVGRPQKMKERTVIMTALGETYNAVKCVEWLLSHMSRRILQKMEVIKLFETVDSIKFMPEDNWESCYFFHITTFEQMETFMALSKNADELEKKMQSMLSNKLDASFAKEAINSRLSLQEALYNCKDYENFDYKTNGHPVVVAGVCPNKFIIYGMKVAT